MDRRFRGEYTFKVDAKGRMSIPASFRRVLEAGDPSFSEGGRPKFVIVYGDKTQQHLEAYTVDEARKLEAKIDRLPNSGLKRKLIRDNITCSNETEIDPDGRLVLPQKLREKIGLAKEATFVGTLATFQIWAPEVYEADGAADDDLGFDLPDGTNPLDALDMVLAHQERS